MAGKKPAVPEVSVNDIASALSKLGIHLYKERTGLPLNQAQRNLNERTDYVADNTLKAWAGQVHAVHVMDEGLVLGIVESFQKGATKDSGRAFRPVFFDVFGRTIYRPENNEAFDTQKQAMADFWKQADEVNAIEETIEGLKAKYEEIQEECKAYKDAVEELS